MSPMLKDARERLEAAIRQLFGSPAPAKDLPPEIRCTIDEVIHWSHEEGAEWKRTGPF